MVHRIERPVTCSNNPTVQRASMSGFSIREAITHVEKRFFRRRPFHRRLRFHPNILRHISSVGRRMLRPCLDFDRQRPSSARGICRRCPGRFRPTGRSAYLEFSPCPSWSMTRDRERPALRIGGKVPASKPRQPSPIPFPKVRKTGAMQPDSDPSG